MMTKKIKFINALFLLSIIVLLFSANAYAGSAWKYTWDNTTIIIPVGESFDKYKDLPKATLYKDNMALSDANITYNTEGDWLFYSKNVNTTKTGVYQVWYKAYENKYIPGTCTGYKALVTFYVKDLEPPKLEIINKEISIKRNTEFDYNSNINCSDNYSKNLDIDFSSNVDFNKEGSYQVNVKVTDEEGNMTTDNFKINIFDNSIPEITFLGEGNDVYVPLNNDFNIKELFIAKDLYDGDISDKIIFPKLKNDSLGDYTYTVSVANSGGRETSYTINLHIVDNVAPTIKLRTNNVVLDYKTNFNNFDFKAYIEKIDDNQDINYNNLNIVHNLENKVGKYSISYEYSDGMYKVSDNIDVSLVSYDKPIIEVDNVVIPIDSNVDLADYVTITDESDNNIEDSLIIDDGDVIYEKEGTYYAKAYCMNSSGLSAEKKIKIVITSDSKYESSNKMSYSITSIILAGLVIVLIIFNISYILITRKSKISNDKNDLI